MKNNHCIHLLTQKESFNEAVVDLLEQSKLSQGVVRVTIFGECASDIEFESRADFLNNCVLDIYGDKAPMVSYVTQPLLDGGKYTAEIAMITDCVEFKELDGVRYIITNDKDSKTLIMCGVKSSVNDSIRKQSDDLFKKISAILSLEGLLVSDIIRQWNYIPQITAVDKDDYQHYQAFNDSRTEFYRVADWKEKGYPAATGIGMDCGAVTVDIIAVKPHGTKTRVIPIDNDLQLAAHVYSQEVLIGAEGDEVEGKSTPKFERAKSVGCVEDGYRCFISGTAAIRGEASMESNDAGQQTAQTIENIEHLISDHTCKKFGVELGSTSKVIYAARAYVKYKEDVDKVKRVVDERWKETSITYLLADVCRDELLVEIEAMARISY